MLLIQRSIPIVQPLFSRSPSYLVLSSSVFIAFHRCSCDPVLPDPEARPSPVFHSCALPSSTKNLLRSNLLSLQLSSPLTLLESTLAQKRGKGGWPLLSSSQLSCCCAGYFQHAPQRELACRLNPRINPKGPWPTPNPFSSKANSQKPTEPSANT